MSINNDMYTAILDEATAMITVIDCATYEVVYANKSAIEATKDTPGEYIGSTCYKYISGSDTPCEHCMMRRAVPVEYEAREVEYGNRVYNQLFKIITWNGKKALLEYSEDITEQRENLKFAEERKNALSSIVNYIPAGIVVFKFEKNRFEVAEANPAVCKMMGIVPEDVVGLSNENVFTSAHPDDIKLLKEVANTLSKPDAQVHYEYRNYNQKENNYLWLSARGRSIGQPDGSVLAYISYTDITEQKRVEELKDKLNVANREAGAKAEFYSRMSHDMRTPMNGILGMAELAMEENDVDKLHEDISKIVQSGKYMLNLINNTLNIQRIETGRMKLEPQIVNGHSIIDSVVTMVKAGIDEKKLEFVLDASEADLDNYLEIDPVRSRQAMMNLLSNAIKFTPEGGQIRLGVKKLSQEGNIAKIQITVSDTGVGMSPEFIRNGIFKPFSQEHNSMTSAYTGSGLGLSIVKSLVELMNGTIKVESELGSGTTFYITYDVRTLTKKEAEQLVSKKTNENKDSYDFGKKRILLCEDHALNAEITTRLLNRVNCTIEWAHNGLEGLEMIKQSDTGYYSAVLMDIRMPVMDGLTAARNIRELSRVDAGTIPIIAMSANAYSEDIQKSIDAGMNKHLSKPIEYKELYKTLWELIGE